MGGKSDSSVSSSRSELLHRVAILGTDQNECGLWGLEWLTGKSKGTA